MAEVFEATWFFLPDIPPYAVCDDLQVLAAWAHRNVPRQGQRARPLLVDNDRRLWFLQADGSLSAVSRKTNSRSPSASERYWRVREGIDAWHQRPHNPHPPDRRTHIPIRVSTLSEADENYLEWLEGTWQSLD
jgi:hypothetical protein